MRFYRSMDDRMLFGVCGGIGAALGINSMIVRLVFVLLALLSRGLAVMIYFLMARMMPMDRGSGNKRESNIRGYKPEAPPFDISDARDVEIDKKEE